MAFYDCVRTLMYADDTKIYREIQSDDDHEVSFKEILKL